MVHGMKPAYLVRLAKKHYTLQVMSKLPASQQRASRERGGMNASASASASSTWTWEHAAPNTVAILLLPPAAITPVVKEEVPDWAIPTYPPPGLHPPDKDARLVRVQISPVIRTDVTALQMMVRTSLLPQGLRQRLAEILLVPDDRLKPLSSTGEPLQEELGIPDEIHVQDVWEKHAVVYDILDIVIGDTEQTRFIVKIDQTWTHDQLLAHLAKILSKNETQLQLLTLNGNTWHYPEDRQHTCTVLVKVMPTPVMQIDLLGSLTEPRGGARTPSPTLPYPGHDQEADVHGQMHRHVPEGYRPPC